MTECGPPIFEADVVRLERRIECTLPTRYREFLLRHNGGRPSLEIFPIDGLENNSFDGIQVFFSIKSEIESCDLYWNLEVMDGRLPANLFAIACTDCGDLICLSLFGDDEGSVFFWDIHQEQEFPTYDNVYFIASSFDEFIDRLYEEGSDFRERLEIGTWNAEIH